MLGWLERLWRRSSPKASPPPARVRARYDSAQTTDDNRRHWANADSLSANSANTLAVRKRLRERSRYERDNNSYAAGLVRTLADDCIGCGPRLDMETEDEAYNEAVEVAWATWCKREGLAEKLRTMRQAKAVDGEAFALLVNRPDAVGVMLGVELVECDQVSNPFGESADNPVDGIRLGRDGKPRAYYVLREHPGELLSRPMLYDLVPAANVVHWFRKDRPGQMRGVPELTPSLPLFAQLRRWTLACLTAAETAADFAVLLKSTAPPDVDTVEPNPFSTLEIERGLMTELPAGYDAAQMKAEHPPTLYETFKRELLKEAGRAVSAPYNVVAGDSSPYNYSSARMDHLLYRNATTVERGSCQAIVLDPMFSAWLDEATRAGAIPEPPGGVATTELPHCWYWSGFGAIDPLKEAQADTEALTNGTTTLAEILAGYGQDWASFLEQRGREVARMRELGIPVPGERTPAASAATSSDQSEERTPAMAAIAASGAASEFRLVGASEGFEVEAIAAEAPTGEQQLRKFKMVAYTGVAINIGYYGAPVVVDLAGMTMPGQRRPILRDHDSSRIVGHTESIEVSEGGTRLKVTGVISGVGSDAQEVLALAGNGFPWQASIGASVQRREFVEAGQQVKVNGRTFNGPLYVARATMLGEVSFVPMGADPNTSVNVAAQPGAGTAPTRGGANPMTFEQWLLAKGFDPSALNDTQRAVLQAAFQAEGEPTPAPTPTPTPSPGAGRGGRTMDEIFAAQRRENERQERITSLMADHLAAHPGLTDELEAMARAAIENGTSVTEFELALLRLARPSSSLAMPRHRERGPESPMVLEAALCMGAGLETIEAEFDERTLEAARRRWRRGLSLGEMLLECARANGYRGHSLRGDLHAVLRAAFSPVQATGSTSPSYHSLASTVLSNTANKYLKVGFDAVDSAWRMITSTRSVMDFKTITSYSLTGDLTYDVVPPGGELKHGTLGAESYTNRADTYGKMLGLDRRDLINDDLGALSGAGRRLGRGAAIKLNKVFWGEFLDNSAFFTAGRNNAFTGGGTALSITSLTAADEDFRIQTDPDGNPLGLMPKILLVPTALRITAVNLVNSELTAPDSTGTANTTVGTMFPTRNPFQGAYTVVSSPYMQDSALTGYSAAAWYLLADPADLPVIETCFLNGQESPTVETADADFGTLGIALRGYHDFGCNLQEYRAGVRYAGA